MCLHNKIAGHVEVALPANRVTDIMLKNRRCLQTTTAIQKLSQTLEVTTATAIRCKQATAQQCHLAQQKILDELVDYMYRQHCSNVMEPVCMVIRHAYDETKMRVRIRLDEDTTHAGIAGSKMFVALSSWTVLAKLKPQNDSDREEFLSVSGCFSPSLRVAESTRGECVAQVLSSCPQMLSPSVMKTFLAVYRVGESDEAKSNLRGERCWGASQDPSLISLHWCCSAQNPQHLRENMVAGPLALAGSYSCFACATKLRAAGPASEILVCRCRPASRDHQ